MCRDINVVMSGVTTRAQKRRMGERDLWDLVVNNDDICFTHVLPRLNATDIKFLYGVNKETRALVKRSTRASDLKKKFKVREMSSVSTLEVAWENRENKSLWPSWWSFWCVFSLFLVVAELVGFLVHGDFCYEVAKTNKLELLK